MDVPRVNLGDIQYLYPPAHSSEFCFRTFYLIQPSSKMASGILKVKGNLVVDGNDESVVLRGAALGGWMK